MRLIRPPDTSFTCRAQGWWPPAGSGLYCAQAGEPLTWRLAPMIESRQALGDGSCIQRTMSPAPLTQKNTAAIVPSARRRAAA